MRKQRKRHVLAAGLAVVLSVGLIPASAFATNTSPSAAGLVQPSANEAAIEAEAAVTVTPGSDEAVALSDEGMAADEVVATVNGQGYPTLAAAIAEAGTNGEVLLEADVNEVVDINSPVNLKLQGHSITAASNYALFAAENTTITGPGSISGTNYGVVASGATVTLDNVTVSGGTAGHVQSNGELIAKGGAALTGTSLYGIYVGSGNTAKIADATVSTSGTYGVINFGTVTMSDGAVTGTSMGVANLGTFTLAGGIVGDGNTTYGIVNQGGTATITGGTATGSYVGLYVSYAGKTDISGGTIKPTASENVEAYAVKINGDTKNEKDGGYASTVNVTGGEIKADQGSLPCGVVILGNGATFKMRGGSIEASAYAISGNGVAENAGTTIEIGGGRIVSTGETACAIYHPQAGTLKINGTATIEGSTGVQLCSGTGIAGSISGGTISATGTDRSVEKPEQDGAVPDGSAISILDRNYPGGIPSFKIIGGVFKSQHSDAVTAYTWSGADRLRSNWTKADEYVSIEGGLFYGNIAEPSEITAPSYVASGHAAVKYDSTGYRVGKLVTLTLNDDGAENADVTYEVRANTADAVSGIIAANGNDNKTYTLVAGSTVLLSATTSSGSVAGWVDEGGTAISSMDSCFYQIITDTALTAQLSSEAATAEPAISLAMTEGSVAFDRYYYTLAATCNVPSSYSVVKAEVRGGTDPNSINTLIASSAGGERQHVFQTYTRASTLTSMPIYYQASLIVSDNNGNQTTVKSNVICVDGSQYASYTDVLGFVPLEDVVDVSL